MADRANDYISSVSRTHKIAIVGAGKVGTTFAYALLLSGLAGEIVLMDKDEQRVEGEVMDLNHAVPLSNPVRIWNGDYSDCLGADIVVVSAGTAQRTGESRLDLLKRNIDIFAQIIPEIQKYNRNGVLLIATNPVDILSYAAWKISGLSSNKVIGSGTVLDTARFRSLLSARLNLDAHNVHAYIIGEHGDSEVAVWSSANIAGIPMEDYCSMLGNNISENDRADIDAQVRNAAYEIISRKGATFYAVAIGLVRVVESILRDQHTVLSVSNLVPGYYDINNVYLSLPTVIGSEGVERILKLNLNYNELDKLQKSAQLMHKMIDQLNL
ncbi:MAG: L-lactate dehydrogenase [Desulfobacterales bacterium]|nr:L-lactate dehydrogenase [Desulfobacterales bacterium]